MAVMRASSNSLAPRVRKRPGDWSSAGIMELLSPETDGEPSAKPELTATLVECSWVARISSIVAGSASRVGLVSIKLTLSYSTLDGATEQVSLLGQVHVPNSP